MNIPVSVQATCPSHSHPRSCCQQGGSLRELCCQIPPYAARLRPAGMISGGDRRYVSSSRCLPQCLFIYQSHYPPHACYPPGSSLHDLCCHMLSYAAHLRPAGMISGGDRRYVSSSRCCTAVSVHLSESLSLMHLPATRGISALCCACRVPSDTAIRSASEARRHDIGRKQALRVEQ